MELYLFTAFISLFSDWTTWRWMLNTIFYCWMVNFCCCCFNLFQSLLDKISFLLRGSKRRLWLLMGGWGQRKQICICCLCKCERDRKKEREVEYNKGYYKINIYIYIYIYAYKRMTTLTFSLFFFSVTTSNKCNFFCENMYRWKMSL